MHVPQQKFVFRFTLGENIYDHLNRAQTTACSKTEGSNLASLLGENITCRAFNLGFEVSWEILFHMPLVIIEWTKMQRVE